VTQQPLDFEAAAIPFQAGSHTSFKAARWLDAKGDRPLKVQRLMNAYREAGEGGLNDSEASAVTTLPRSSICSLRACLANCGLVERAGERVGAYGIRQTVHRITQAGAKL
jgi:hypothetical protein